MAAVLLAAICVAGTALAQTSFSGPIVVQGAETLGPFTPTVFTGDLRDLPTVSGW